MRLIDADKLIESLNKKYGDNENINESVFYLIGAISGASTVDAVEVVRCEDCKYFEDEDEDGDCWCYCHNDITCRDGYCSWGVKK